MKTLSLHIERLLLHHDCVVVPHFGAFVVRDNSATRSDAENIFFPPSRIVRFNPDIVDDDNLLVSAVRHERRCNTADAKHAIQEMVLNLRQQLLADGQVDFGTIGLFTQDEDGALAFSACQAGVTTPRYYGLDPFTMPRLAIVQATRKPRRTSAQLLRDRADSDHITIHLSRRVLRNTAAAAAIALLCTLFSSPFQLDDIRRQQASVLTTQHNVTLAPARTNDHTTTVTPKPHTATPNPHTAITEAPATHSQALEAVSHPANVAQPQADIATTPASSPLCCNTVAAPAKAPVQPTHSPSLKDNNFCVVLASNVSRKNAQAFVFRLHDMGYTHARLHDNGNILRVIIDGCATESDAAKLAHQIHQHGAEFAAAWVMKL